MQKLLLGGLALLCFSCANGHSASGLPQPIADVKQFDLAGPQGINIHVYQTRPTTVKREIIWVHGMPGVPAGDAFAPPVFFDDEAPADTIITYYDRPGFGMTTTVPGGFALSFQLEVIEVLLAQNPGIPHYMAGWSAGGTPTLAATLKFPALVNGAFIASGAVRPLPAALLNQLPQLNVPIALVHGDSDPIVPHNHMTYLAAQIKKAGKESLLVEARTLKGVDHAVVRNHAKDVLALLEKVIATAEKPVAPVPLPGPTPAK